MLKCQRCGCHASVQPIAFKLSKQLIPLDFCLTCAQRVYDTAAHQAKVFESLVDMGFSGKAAAEAMKTLFISHAS